MRTNTNGIRKLSENFDRVQGLMSYINEATLLKEHRRQSRKKATRIDGVSLL